MLKRMTALLLSLLLVLPLSVLSESDEPTPTPKPSYDLQEDDLEIVDVIEPAETEDPGDVPDKDGSITITVTCTGDFTIGGDSYHNKGKKFYSELDKHGKDINFTMRNVKDIFREDDLTLVNFEGTFTPQKGAKGKVPDSKKHNDFLFNIDPGYVNVLTDNYIEAVSLANNHVMDYGTEGYEETKRTLYEAGVQYSTAEDLGVCTVDGVDIAMLSYLCIDLYDKPVGGFDNLYDKVAHDIQVTKQQYPIVIVSFHWGRELDYTPNDRQKRMGRLAVDSGADLVIGNHSHRINPIEFYNGSYICYSLGNFCFAGNDKPKDMNSILFQTRFKVSKTGDVTNTGFRIIPIRITSLKDRNDYTPTPVTDPMRIDGIIATMKDNGKDFGVSDYPLEWK